MIADLKPYSAMKDSGVPWLGEVPEHWVVLPNRAIFMEIKERERPEEQMLSVTITKGVIPQQKLLADSSKKDSSNQDKSAYKVVRSGDIAYNKMRAWQGAIGVSDYQGIVSPAYVVQRPRDGAHPRYFHYLLRTPTFAKEAERWSYGITSDMWSLRSEHFKMIYGCVPPLPEQAAIVRFLDYMDRRIRKYIRAKQKLVKLLEEQKQAIIHRAVTSGLDPNVRLKPSGVEWLGDVPKHWDVVKLKRLGEVRIGLTYSPGDVSSEDGMLVLRASNIRDGRVVTGDNVYVSKDVPKTLRVGEGDILICVRSGSRRLVGKSALITKEYGGVTYGAFMSLLRSEDNAFLFWVLNSHLLPSVMAQFETSTINQLTQADLKNLSIPFPPTAERGEITAFLISATAEIDATTAAARREIDLLREYRTRLIADVVTGKLDVREVAANLPDEP